MKILVSAKRVSDPNAKLSISSDGKWIEGDVEYASLEMHKGALITGQLRPLLTEEAKPTLKLAANNQ